jgi:hypothetical protein
MSDKSFSQAERGAAMASPTVDKNGKPLTELDKKLADILRWSAGAQENVPEVTPPYVVLVQGADDLENLRDMAYAAANKIRSGSTEHWDERRSSEIAFCFMTANAATCFSAHCARTGISYRRGDRAG